MKSPGRFRAVSQRGGLALALVLVSALAACAPAEASCLDSGDSDCRNADLAGRDLSGRSFDGWDFSGADLTGADLSAGSFVGAVFDRALLDRVDATGAVFAGASFFSTSMVDAVLDAADLVDAALEGTDLRRASLTGSRARGARLHEVNFSSASLEDADLSGALFARSYLPGASLEGARLDAAVFADTDLRSTALSGASWAGALLRAEDPLPAPAELPGAVICSVRACSDVTIPSPADLERVPPLAPEAFSFGAVSVTRVGMTYGESPLVVARNLALSYLGAVGLYPGSEDRGVEFWEPTLPAGAAEVTVPDAVRDVAAVYALQNTAIGLRLSPRGREFDGRMRDLILSREVTLWESTRGAPVVRSFAASLGVGSSSVALSRADRDGFGERSTKYDDQGAWVPTPPAFVPALEPNWGTSVRRFLSEARQCTATPPVGDILAKAEQTREMGTKASDDQRAAARFWDDERVRTATPPGHWVYIAADFVEPRLREGGISVGEAFVVMSDLTLVMSDTLGQVWEEKYRYRTARPQTVLADAGVEWRSYLTNPPFPAYPSGHAAISRAAAEVLTHHLGSVPFRSDGATESAGGNRIFNVTPREFEDFRAAASEAGMSRVWGGIHTVEDIDGGIEVGSCVAALRIVSSRR